MALVRFMRVEGRPEVELPRYQTKGSAGLDLPAAVEGDVVILPGETELIPCGFAIEISEGYEGQVRPRSGLALKHGITVLNSPGTIDSDYRGEVAVMLTNLGEAPFTVSQGDRIAQLVICPVVRAIVRVVKSLTDSKRGTNGFGSTGVKSEK